MEPLHVAGWHRTNNKGTDQFYANAMHAIKLVFFYAVGLIKCL